MKYNSSFFSSWTLLSSKLFISIGLIMVIALYRSIASV